MNGTSMQSAAGSLSRTSDYAATRLIEPTEAMGFVGSNSEAYSNVRDNKLTHAAYSEKMARSVIWQQRVAKLAQAEQAMPLCGQDKTGVIS